MKSEYDLDGGKYTIVYNDEYPSKVLRYREPWINDLDNAHRAMAMEISKLVEQLNNKGE